MLLLIKMLVKWMWSCGFDINCKLIIVGSFRFILRFYVIKDDDKILCLCRVELFLNEIYNEMFN